MAADVKKISLVDVVHPNPTHGVKFLAAEWWDDKSPFVVIRYREHGAVGTLRMDLFKGAFLDHLDDPATDDAVQQQAVPISEIVEQARG